MKALAFIPLHTADLVITFQVMVAFIPLHKADFVITSQVMVAIKQKEGEKERPYLNLMVKSIGTKVTMRTFDMMVDAYLGTVCVPQLQYQCEETMIPSHSIAQHSLAPLPSLFLSLSVSPTLSLSTPSLSLALPFCPSPPFFLFPPSLA